MFRARLLWEELPGRKPPKIISEPTTTEMEEQLPFSNPPRKEEFFGEWRKFDLRTVKMRLARAIQIYMFGQHLIKKSMRVDVSEGSSLTAHMPPQNSTMNSLHSNTLETTCQSRRSRHAWANSRRFLGQSNGVSCVLCLHLQLPACN